MRDHQRRRVARYYRGARTTHLERLREMVPGDFFYQKAMYDFAMPELPTDVQVERVNLRRMLAMVWRGDYEVLEIVEPYAPSALPQTLALSFVARASRLRLGTKRTQLVSYAIENADLPAKFADRYHLPLGLTRLLIRGLVRYGFMSLERIVYGTEDAQRNYRELLGPKVLRNSRAPSSILVWGLPAARAISPHARTNRSKVVFVGAFDDRKGLSELLAAWPYVKLAVPEAELSVLGKGPNERAVRELVPVLESVSLMVDPARDRIWSELESASVLVLLSQPAAGWKEQIGLPIVEGLSVGLEVVASTETGIASWLTDQGHRTLAPDCGAEELASSIAQALRGARPKAMVQAALPAQDGRLLADAWLMSQPG